MAGLALLATLGVQLVTLLTVAPAAGRGVLTSVALEFVAPREAAFAVALAAGAPPSAVALASILQNLAVAALVLPFVSVLLDRWRTQNHFLARRLRRLEAAALRRRAFITRWGPLGIFAFMLVPFLANGALVSSVLARVCAIPVRHMVAPIVLATILVASAWAFAYERLLAWLGDVNPAIPGLVAGALAVAVVGWMAWQEWRETRPQSSDP